MDASQKVTGACLVCGKTCTLRCSACAQKSNIDLYFCSSDHQKLVGRRREDLLFPLAETRANSRLTPCSLQQIWPFHRLVCGDRSHPFKLPPFSKEEAEVTYARTVDLPESARDAGHQIYLQRLLKSDQFSRDELKVRFVSLCRSTHCKSREFRQQLGLTGACFLYDDIEARIDSLVGVEAPMLDHRYPSRSLNVTGLAVRGIRILNSSWHSDVPAKSPSLSFLETFHAFYHQLTAAGHDVADDSRWYSEYCHRVSVQLALMILVMSATKQQVGGNDTCQTAVDKLVEAREANVVAMRHFLEKVVNDPRLGAFAQSGIRAADKTLEMLRHLYGRKLA